MISFSSTTPDLSASNNCKLECSTSAPRIQVEQTLAKYLISHQNKLLATIVESTTNTNQEFIEVNSSGLVLVKEIKHELDLRRAPAQIMLADDFGELGTANVATVVIVSNAELASKTKNARRPTFL
jgi:hypothetical protein